MHVHIDRSGVITHCDEQDNHDWIATGRTWCAIRRDGKKLGRLLMAGGVATGGSPVAAALACRTVNRTPGRREACPQYCPSGDASRSRLPRGAMDDLGLRGLPRWISLCTPTRTCIREKNGTMAMAFS
jgi:hypothetical protein